VESLDADPSWLCLLRLVTTDEAGQPLARQPSVNSPTRQMSGNIFRPDAADIFPPHTVMIRRPFWKRWPFRLSLGVTPITNFGCASRLPDTRLLRRDPLAYYRTYATSMSKDSQHWLTLVWPLSQKLCRLHPDLIAQSPPQFATKQSGPFSGQPWLNRNLGRCSQESLGPFQSAPEDKGGDRALLLKTFFRSQDSVRGKNEQVRDRCHLE